MRRVVPAALLAAITACASSTWLARVNDETVTGKELRQEFARHHTALEKILSEDADVRKYVGRLVDRRLFVQEAYRMGLQDAPDVQESVARIRSQRMIELFRREEVEAKSTVSDDEVKAVWDGLKEQLEIRQVVVATKPEGEAVAAAVAAGTDLEKLAREKSIADSAKQGGMLVIGWGVDEAYEKTLFPLADGAVSPPFKSQAGWEVVRVEKHKAVDRPPLDKVSGRIRQVLQKRKRLAREEEVYAGLWTRYDAKLQDCAPDVESLKAAAARKDQAACATWRGGKVTVEALAGRVKLDQLASVGGRWPDVRKVLIEDLVNRELVLAEAETLGYGARPEVTSKVASARDDYVESKLYRDHVVKGITASEEDARKYFEANAAQFAEEPSYELAQVLVDTPEIASEVEQKVRSRQPFAEIARAYSKDRRNAADGGKVGFVPRSMLKDEFAPVAALNEGDVSAPIRAADGYHVVKVLSVTPERKRPYEEVKDQARARALEEKQKAEVERWVATLRVAATIKINDRGIRAYGKEVREEQEREKEARRASAAAAKAAAAAPPAAPAPAVVPGAPAGAPAAPAPDAAPGPAPASVPAPASAPASGPGTAGAPAAAHP